MNERYSELYRQYVIENSPEWQSKKQQKYCENKKFNGGKIYCELCYTERPILGFDVHHLTYERLGRELLSDLQVLCHDCHKIADKRRKNPNYIDKGVSWDELARDIQGILCGS